MTAKPRQLLIEGIADQNSSLRNDLLSTVLDSIDPDSRDILTSLIASNVDRLDVRDSQKLYLDLQLERPASGQYHLKQFRFGLGWQQNDDFRLYHDFNSGALGHRLLQPQSAKQDIGRAVGLKPGFRPRILDCNAGLGKDAAVLAALGCRVHCVERQALVYVVLADAMRRALEPGSKVNHIIENIELSFENAELRIQQSDSNDFDSVYLDPMFPERHKTALVKRDSRILSQYCGKDEDAEKLLFSALARGFRRVCVKRPLFAPYLGQLKPQIQYKGKSTRYDVYVTV